MADEVEHVEVVEQGALQPRQGGVLEDRDREPAARDEVDEQGEIVDARMALREEISLQALEPLAGARNAGDSISM